MAKTPSTMLELGTRAPDFNLLDPAAEKMRSLSDFVNSALLVVFSCNHCPYVLHILRSFCDYASNAQKQGLSVVMINTNDTDQYPADSQAKMIELAAEYDFKFPYLIDESQAIAKAYMAACTPDFFLFSQRHELVYRGRYDAATPGNDEAVTGSDLKAATDALLKNDTRITEQWPSLGCNIKWKSGNEPAYYN